MIIKKQKRDDVGIVPYGFVNKQIEKNKSKKQKRDDVGIVPYGLYKAF